jgi:alpha-1,3/alpha-1,6-mannosyltransferase
MLQRNKIGGWSSRVSGVASSSGFVKYGKPGGYDPRLEDNVSTLKTLLEIATTRNLTYHILTPSKKTGTLPPFDKTVTSPDVVFLLSFTTSQRSALLTSSSTLALLYTPTNEHFGIVPVEAMACGVPVLACNTGGPTESVVNSPEIEKTGWLRPPDPEVWAETLRDIVELSVDERKMLAHRAKVRARTQFGMDAMASKIEAALLGAVRMGSVEGGSQYTFAVAFLASALVLTIALYLVL